MYKVLLVEDDELMRDTVTFQLKDIAQVKAVDTIQGALNSFEDNEQFDLLILDENLPDGKGIDLLKVLKENEKFSKVRSEAIILTGEKNISRKIDAFNMGAHDYIIKPMDNREFKARVSSKLDFLSQSKENTKEIQVGNLYLDITHRTVELTKNSEKIKPDLTPKEFDILWFFASRVGQAVSRQKIMKEVWNEVNVSSRTIDAHISKVKKKILGSEFTFVGEYGKGYKFTNNLSK